MKQNKPKVQLRLTDN